MVDARPSIPYSAGRYHRPNVFIVSCNCRIVQYIGMGVRGFMLLNPVSQTNVEALKKRKLTASISVSTESGPAFGLTGL